MTIIEEDCRWVEFIKCMRCAGLPIEALIEYVTLFQKGDETVGARYEQPVVEKEKTLKRSEN